MAARTGTRMVLWFIPVNYTIPGWHEYGGFKWSVTWRLPTIPRQSGEPCPKPLSGWIVQKVTRETYWWPNGDATRAQARGTRGGAPGKPYWEAWEVRNGNIYREGNIPAGPDAFGYRAEIKRMDDGTLEPFAPNTTAHYAGEKKTMGEVVFMEGDGDGELPGFTYDGGVNAALGLQSTYAKPSFWDEVTSRGLARTKKVEYQYNAQTAVEKFVNDTPDPENMEPSYLDPQD